MSTQKLVNGPNFLSLQETTKLLDEKQEEKQILRRLLKCCDINSSPRTRLNAFWKVILKAFRDFVCKKAEAKLEKLIGPNNFFGWNTCDMMNQDSTQC